MEQTITTLPYDYAREAAILARYLQPGQPPLGDRFGWEQPTQDEMVYLGEVDFVLYTDIPIRKLTLDPVLQGILRENAIGEDIYDEEDDLIDFQLEELTVDVSCSFAHLSPLDQARYRLVSLLVNSQGILEGEAHSWALSTMRDLAHAYWERSFAKREGWRDESGCNEGNHCTFDLLAALQVDLERWCRAYDIDRDEEIPLTPPLAWVKEIHLAEVLHIDRDEEIDYALAYALHALYEGQPEHGWDTSLYLADAVVCNLPTFEETRDRLAQRIASIPVLHAYAARIRGASDMEEVNAVLGELYDKAETLRLWVVA